MAGLNEPDTGVRSRAPGVKTPIARVYAPEPEPDWGKVADQAPMSIVDAAIEPLGQGREDGIRGN